MGIGRDGSSGYRDVPGKEVWAGVPAASIRQVTIPPCHGT